MNKNKKYCLKFNFTQKEFECLFEDEQDFKQSCSSILMSMHDKSMYHIHAGIIINLSNLNYIECFRFGLPCQYNITYDDHNHIKGIEFV